MKENNYFRLKIYFLIFIVAYVSGWSQLNQEIVMVVGNREYYKQTFNYGDFGFVVFLGFGITILYDIYVMYKNKKKNKKNE